MEIIIAHVWVISLNSTVGAVQPHPRPENRVQMHLQISCGPQLADEIDVKKNRVIHMTACNASGQKSSWFKYLFWVI